MTEFWEDRYADSEQVWSGEPNPMLVAIASDLPAGRALDLGCGEGGDSVWLAENGWHVTGVDISSTAVARAAALAERRGIPDDRVSWVAEDLATWEPTESYDLVSAFYLHSPVEFPRADVLRRIARAVAPGGHLLIVGHAGFPPWAEPHVEHEHHFNGPEEEIESLDLPLEEWETLLGESRPRELKGPEGQTAVVDDVIVLLQRS